MSTVVWVPRWDRTTRATKRGRRRRRRTRRRRRGEYILHWTRTAEVLDPAVADDGKPLRDGPKRYRHRVVHRVNVQRRRPARRAVGQLGHPRLQLVRGGGPVGDAAVRSDVVRHAREVPAVGGVRLLDVDDNKVGVGACRCLFDEHVEARYKRGSGAAPAIVWQRRSAERRSGNAMVFAP